MATYRVTAPDGKVYQVTPPEGQQVTQDEVLARIQAQHAAPPPQADWQAGTARTPFTAPRVTGNRTADIALEPLTGYRGRLNEAFRSADAMAEHGAKTLAKGDITGLAGFLPGIAGAAAAPVSAALEPLSRPINEYVSPLLEKTFGTPPEVATPVLTSLIPGLGVTKVPTPKSPPSLPAPRVRLSPAPSSQELRTQGGRAFKAADDAGVIFSGKATERLRREALEDLEEFGFDDDLHPRVKAVLKRLNVASPENPDGNITLKGLEIVRRVAMNAAKSPEKQERLLAWKLIDRITELQRAPEAGEVLMGDAQRGAQALADAREIWARMSKSELIDLAIETAFTRAKRTGSGGNIDNTVRQNVSKILGKDENPRGFSKEEIAVLKEISHGTTLRNALRLFGKMSPTGVVSGGFGLGAVALTPGGWGLMVPVVGFLSKLAGDKMTIARARGLSESIRRNGPNRPAARVRARPSIRRPSPPALTYEPNRTP